MGDLTTVLRRQAGRWTATALVLATLLAVLAGAPAPGPGLLALAAVAAAGHLLVRRRRRGGLDALLVGVGGSLVGLVFTGMLLALTGVGLRPATWAVGVAALAAVCLVIDVVIDLVIDRVMSARQPTATSTPTSTATSTERGRSRPRWPALLRALPWVVASVVALAVAVGGSVRSLSAADQPPLAMSLSRVDGTDVQVVVRTGEAVGPLELRSTNGGTDVSYPLFDVGEDGSRTLTLSLPLHGRFTITLNNPDQTQPLRTLILDR